MHYAHNALKHLTDKSITRDQTKKYKKNRTQQNRNIQNEIPTSGKEKQIATVHVRDNL